MVKSLRQVDCSHPTSHYILKFLLPPPPRRKSHSRPDQCSAISLANVYSADYANPIQHIQQYFYIDSFSSAFKFRLIFFFRIGPVVSEIRGGLERVTRWGVL